MKGLEGKEKACPVNNFNFILISIFISEIQGESDEKE